MFAESLPHPGPAIRVLSLMARLAPPGRKVFDRSILIRRKYGRTEPVLLPEGLYSAWAGVKETAYMDAHSEATSSGAYSRRVSRGDLCLCLKRGEEVIGYRWAKRGSACLFCGFGPGYEILFFPLRPDQVFVYDSYVYSAHRGHSYNTLLRRLMHQALQREGVRESYALVAPENTTSLKLTLRTGSEPLCMAYGIRIRDWNKVILGPRPDAQLMRWIARFKRREGID